jgi:cytochrome P450
MTVLGTGIPHVTAEDDTYRGHFIPKGTIVLPNQWALLRDPVMFPEPLRFSPERYLTHTQSPKSAESSRGDKWTPRSDVRDPRDFAFGFGRRICPGSHIAEQSLFATIATVLHTIDVRRVKDADGVDIIPEVDVSGGSLSHPLPFVYEIQMRSDAKELVDMCSQK